MRDHRLDPLTLEILWQRLITVADQMSTTLARTAFSTTITASNDYGCVIMDARGDCIAHAHRSLPIFNRTMPHTTRLVLERFGRKHIAPGDVFISNDPWQNAGHNPDITVITPFFKAGNWLDSPPASPIMPMLAVRWISIRCATVMKRA